MITYKLTPLPYPAFALDPFLSEQNVEAHRKLQAGYVKTAHELTRKAKRPERGDPYDTVYLENAKNAIKLHELWWENLQPFQPGRLRNPPPRTLMRQLGLGLRKLKDEVKRLGLGLVGSGWVVVGLRGRRETTVRRVKNHEMDWSRYEPLLVIDVWEHAYYYDYTGHRKEFLEDVWAYVNWEVVAGRLGEARAGALG